MINETKIGNSGITPERKKVSDMKPEELDRFLEIEEFIRKTIVRPMQNREEQRKVDREAEGKIDWMDYDGEDDENPMDYLRQNRPEHEKLATEYYSLMGAAALAPEEVQDEFNRLNEDPLNIPDIIEMYGEQAYRDVIQAVRDSIETRKKLASEVLASYREVGEDFFKRYYYMVIQKEGSLSVEMEELFEIYYQGMNLNVLASESYRILVRFRDLLNSINADEVIEFMKSGATKKQRDETRERKGEKIRKRKELVYTLDEFRDNHALFLLIERMNIRTVDGKEIKNSQMIRSLPYDTLKKLADKAEQLIRLAEEYGVDIEWYSQEEMDYLLDELFSEER